MFLLVFQQGKETQGCIGLYVRVRDGQTSECRQGCKVSDKQQPIRKETGRIRPQTDDVVFKGTDSDISGSFRTPGQTIPRATIG